MSKKPVLICGANDFSGRLIAEFLREYNTPFIAAGRSSARIKDVMDHVPAIETADFEIVETAGSLESSSGSATVPGSSAIQRVHSSTTDHESLKRL